jgi:L-ascorbate metabolism protein UlaG (beta-lactamase superfamily)
MAELLRRSRREGKKFHNPVPTQVGGLSVMFKVFPQYLRSTEEKSPIFPVGPFKTDATVYQTPPGSGLRVTWFGHSSSLVEIDGVRVLIDPVWDERAAPVQWAGPKRFFAPTIDLEALPRIDVVLISHDHYDHLGAGSVRRLALAFPSALWVTSLGVGKILAGFGVPEQKVTELDWTQSTTFPGGLTITSVPSRHFSGRSLLNRFETLWGAFVLKGAKHTVYYGADTGWWEGFGEVAATYGPFDLTMLEIGAFHELWADIHLGPDNAVRAFEAMGAKGLMMPIHWGLFDLALHGWRQPMERMTELIAERGTPVWSPEPGCPTEVLPGQTMCASWWRK